MISIVALAGTAYALYQQHHGNRISQAEVDLLHEQLGDERRRHAPFLEIDHRPEAGRDDTDSRIDCRIRNSGGGTARRFQATILLGPTEWRVPAFEDPRTLGPGEHAWVGFGVHPDIVKGPTGELQAPDAVVIEVEYADDVGPQKKRLVYPPA